ncbi:Hypothetical Protein FCC1311_069452 [Hondaea fermentalgiana]|uniref:Uncharacterized protein n=1 Tax=Hondaea fermentalgiana TaxID=2315210 RepID=A0A2R5GJD2_9STRA|nr:Hypothetical Protein FCC1311_069452 [Hondaea fermentalgiana]|eukprot:GBG30725.1 Hypothetical Protein FCC1311_069452 [Hondaea fermentalgiana]
MGNANVFALRTTMYRHFWLFYVACVFCFCVGILVGPWLRGVDREALDSVKPEYVISPTPLHALSSSSHPSVNASADDAPGAAAVLVTGMHHTGTSILTLLLMNLGLEAGRRSDLLFLPGNKVKYFELARAEHLNEDFLLKTTDKTNPPWPAYGHEWDRASLQEQTQYVLEVKKVLDWLDTYAGPEKSWVLKDPRLCLLAEAYLTQVTNRKRICIIPHRDPIEVASRFVPFARGWPLETNLELWEEYNVRAIQACRRTGATIIQVSHFQMMTEPYELAKYLHAKLVDAGVKGVFLPSEDGFQKRFLKLWFNPDKPYRVSPTGGAEVLSKLEGMISTRAKRVWEAQRTYNLEMLSDAELIPKSWTHPRFE